MKKVLFLCHGNINRSVAAELLTKKYFPSIDVDSAGLKDSAGGELISKKMRTVLKETNDIDSMRRSKKCNHQMMEWADIVFYMDNGNRKRIEDQFPEYMSKCQSLAACLGIPKIPDPAFSKGIDEYHKVVRYIHKAIEHHFTLDQ